MNLKPCPFCGHAADIKREGTSRQSMIVECTNCGASAESNEITANSKPENWWWNHRVIENRLEGKLKKSYDRGFYQALRQAGIVTKADISENSLSK